MSELTILSLTEEELKELVPIRERLLGDSPITFEQATIDFNRQEELLILSGQRKRKVDNLLIEKALREEIVLPLSELNRLGLIGDYF